MTKRLCIVIAILALVFSTCLFTLVSYAQKDAPLKKTNDKTTSSATGKARQKATTPKIKRIRFHRHNKYTRVVIDVSEAAQYALASQNTPPALIIDLLQADISELKKKVLNVGGERIKAIEVVKLGWGIARVTIKTKFIRDYRIFKLKDPSRIVIDIKEKTITGYREPRPTKRPRAQEAELPDEIPDKIDESYDDYPAQPGETPGRSERTIKISGFVGNETAYRISDKRELTKSRNTLKLNLRGELTDNISYRIGGRSYYDAVFDMTGNYPDNVEKDQETELELRETYLDVSLGNMDLRIGKQTIVWGEAVGLFFADQVNAKDLREFVLADFDDIRKPQWSALVEYTGDLSHLEFVWIPVLEFNDYGESGSEFPVAIAVPMGVTPTVASTDEPANNFNNSELGARFSYFLGGWDLTVFHLYTWDKTATNYRSITSPTLHTFNPNHERLNISGFTVATEIRNIIFKTEFTYIKGKRFSIIDSSDSDGIVQADYIDYLIGMDYTILKKVEMNIQFMQKIIPDHDGRFFREEHIKNTASFRLKTGFYDNIIEPEILILSNLEETDLMIRPKVSFRGGQNWQLAVGADIFAGEEDGLFGQYDKNDRAYMKIDYNF
ncbi:hypothetical protein MNBD_DELTA01-1796 [hydrothermal vent metagenome]|uniref:AMIN domain-containing protein n=1 Tax=hydrothermal vent metagenome TaxID=652676 RepID=A0A3B0RQ39_9ZZZZ